MVMVLLAASAENLKTLGKLAQPLSERICITYMISSPNQPWGLQAVTTSTTVGYIKCFYHRPGKGAQAICLCRYDGHNSLHAKMLKGFGLS